MARWAWGLVLVAYALVAIPPVAAHVIPAFPSRSSDAYAYDLATRGRFMGLLPVQHIVYGETGGAGAGANGAYDPESGTILIRLRGGALPVADYLAILRHEYGHALLRSWCVARGYGAAAFDRVLADRSGAASGVPSALAGAESDFFAEPGLFGDYARSSLGEWMAEAYVAHVAGEPLPARTQTFFDSLTDPACVP